MHTSKKTEAVHPESFFINLDRCPICSGNPLLPYKKATFAYRFLRPEQINITDKEYGKIWDLSRCPDCGYIFANPQPAPVFIRSLYKAVEDPLYEEEAKGRVQNFIPILHQLEKIRPEKGILFDVGAATGILLNAARNRGWQTDGVEPSAWAVKKARQKYKLALREGDFETLSLEPGRYDAVSMVDFIEHISSPLTAAKKAARILRPEGILCVVTPDIASAAARLLGYKWWHYRPGHLGYFTQKSLIELLKRAGFSIIKKRRYSWTFSLHYLLSRKKTGEVLLKSPWLASLSESISIKLALCDSLEVYARKGVLS